MFEDHEDVCAVERAAVQGVSHTLECDETAVQRVWADVLRSNEYVPVDKLKNGVKSYVQIRRDSRL